MEASSKLKVPGFTAESSVSLSPALYAQRISYARANEVQPAYNEVDCIRDCRRMHFTVEFAACACLGICK